MLTTGQFSGHESAESSAGSRAWELGRRRQRGFWWPGSVVAYGKREGRVPGAGWGRGQGIRCRLPRAVGQWD